MKAFKIGLIGYGNMGKEIHKLAKEKNMVVSAIYDEDNPLFESNTFDFDVAIDFSIPSAVVTNAEIVAKANKNLVIGTTGWYDNTDIIRQIAIDNNIGIVWGANFSIGMQIFFKLVNYASELANKVDGYDIFMHEIHHSKKKDSPSGTALNLAKIIVDNIDSKRNIQINTAHGEINKNQLHVTSTRGGFVPGTHTVYLDSVQDTIELTHRARNRSGFAGGALKAAELIYEKKGFVSFEELLEDYWKNS
jgi:4-hydroxy-tetrahydrodipicolinate reductase